MTAAVNYVLCEGYEDRAFWRGLLHHLGCSDAPRTGGAVLDPRDCTPISGGRYAFVTRSGAWIVVQPVGGRDKMLSAVKVHVDRLSVRPLSQLVVNIDCDLDASELDSRSVDDYWAYVAQAIGCTTAVGARRWRKDDALISGVVWECHAPDQSAVPSKQTLERLICTAIHALEPECARNVCSWLTQGPESCVGQSSRRDHKRELWSLYGKWLVDCGSEHLFTRVWELPNVPQEMTKLLQATGAWSVIEGLIR